jgi:hypothetical protein
MSSSTISATGSACGRRSGSSCPRVGQSFAGRSLSGHDEHLTVGGGLPEGKALTPGEGPESWTSDVREHEAPDSKPSGLARDGQRVHVPADASGEPDRTLPCGPLREHDVRATRPAGELIELRSPGDRVALRPDAVAVGRVIRVDHGAHLDAQPVLLKARGTRPESPGSGQPADRCDELRALVRHQPGVRGGREARR